MSINEKLQNRLRSAALRQVDDKISKYIDEVMTDSEQYTVSERYQMANTLFFGAMEMFHAELVDLDTLDLIHRKLFPVINGFLDEISSEEMFLKGEIKNETFE